MGVESMKGDNDIAGQECLKNHYDLVRDMESENPLGDKIENKRELQNSACDGNESDNDDDNDCYHDANYDLQTAKIQNVLTVENIKNPKTREDYRYLHYPTIRLKSIKRALSLCGHTIVGDGGAVKSAKGIFAAVVKVTIFDSDYCEQNHNQYHHQNEREQLFNDASFGKDTDITMRRKYEPIIISVENPKKFQKLLSKEQELWERAEDRDQVLISAWNQDQMNGVNGNTDNGFCVTDEGTTVQADLIDNGLLKDEYSEGFQNALTRCHLDDNIADRTYNYNNDHDSGKIEIANNRQQSKVKSQFSSLESMRDALSSGMPVEYVLGEAKFCGLDFEVDSNVMVPRKSSEVLVNQATSLLSNICPKVPTVSTIECTADLGSHSGIEEVDRGSRSRVRDEDRKCVRVLDIGTGSGCLLLSSLKKYIEEQEQNYQRLHTEHSLLYHEKDIPPFPSFHCNITGVGIDISPEALAVAAANSIKMGLENNTVFRALDFANLSDLVPALALTEIDPHLVDPSKSIEDSDNSIIRKSENPLFEEKTDTDTNAESFPKMKIEECSLGSYGPYDVILCNPPYSSRRERSRLSVACREHEPSLALFSPLGPLAAYRILATSFGEAEEKYQSNLMHSKQLLNQGYGLFASNAHVILEVGHGQDIPVRKIFDKLPFLIFVRGEKDHKGIDRCLIYRYQNNG